MEKLLKIFKTSGSKGLSLTLVLLFTGLLVVSAPPVSAQEQESQSSFRSDGSLESMTYYGKDGGKKIESFDRDSNLESTVYLDKDSVASSAITYYEDGKVASIRLYDKDGAKVKIDYFSRDGSLEATRYFGKDGNPIETKTYDKNEGALKVLAAAGEKFLRRSGNLKEDADGKPDKKNPPEFDSVVDDLLTGVVGQPKQDKTDTAAGDRTGIGNFLESSPEDAFAEFESVLSVFLGKNADGKPDKENPPDVDSVVDDLSTGIFGQPKPDKTATAKQRTSKSRIFREDYWRPVADEKSGVFGSSAIMGGGMGFLFAPLFSDPDSITIDAEGVLNNAGGTATDAAGTVGQTP